MKQITNIYKKWIIFDIRYFNSDKYIFMSFVKAKDNSVDYVQFYK